MYDIAIVGSGPAGISAAINCKIRNKSFVIFGEKELSHKIEISKEINNYPGLPSISGEQLNKAMNSHLTDMDIEITQRRITGIYKMKDKFILLADRDQFEAKSVILALGAETVKPIPMERELLGRGVSYCATCDGMFYKDKIIAVFCDSIHHEEEVEYLASLAKKVYYYPSFKSDYSASNVEHLESKIVALKGENKISSILLDNGTEIEVDGMFFLKQAVAADVLLAKLEVKKGSIAVNRDMATNIDGCFAAGDCTGAPYQITKAVGEGNVAAHSSFAYLSNL